MMEMMTVVIIQMKGVTAVSTIIPVQSNYGNKPPVFKEVMSPFSVSF